MTSWNLNVNVRRKTIKLCPPHWVPTHDTPAYLDDHDIDEHLPSTIYSNYHTSHVLSVFKTSPTDLSLFHINIRSLSCRFDELQSLLVNLNTDFNVVAVSETWDSFERPLSTNNNIPGFKFFSSKSRSQNGGVGLYIKTSKGIENSKDKNILICCVYHHPNTEIEHFAEFIFKESYLINNKLMRIVANKHVFILGEFKINLLNYDNHTSTRDFASLIFSQHFFPYITHPTRVSIQSSAILANVFSNICNFDTKSGNILTQSADHFPLFLVVKKAGITSKALSYYQHDYLRFDQEKFLGDFNNLYFDYLNVTQSDVNAKFNRFLADLDEIVKKHAPLKKITKEDMIFRNKPWINSRIKKMMVLQKEYPNTQVNKISLDDTNIYFESNSVKELQKLVNK